MLLLCFHYAFIMLSLCFIMLLNYAFTLLTYYEYSRREGNDAVTTAAEDKKQYPRPHASTVAPPTGKDGVSVAHAAATSAGGGRVEEPETIVYCYGRG
jgi:3-oxoacyl-ACP reductase-like protein